LVPVSAFLPRSSRLRRCFQAGEIVREGDAPGLPDACKLHLPEVEPDSAGLRHELEGIELTEQRRAVRIIRWRRLARTGRQRQQDRHEPPP
jgi:hypothetical protein